MRGRIHSSAELDDSVGGQRREINCRAEGSKRGKDVFVKMWGNDNDKLIWSAGPVAGVSRKSSACQRTESPGMPGDTQWKSIYFSRLRAHMYV